MAVAPWIVSDKLWNRHDVTQLIPLLEAVPAGPRDRARVRPRPLPVGRRAHLCLQRNFKRLLVRYERRTEMHEALLGLACCLVCYRRLRSSI
jgi:hypothetical protein